MDSVLAAIKGTSSMPSARNIAFSIALLSSLPAAIANAGEPAAGSAETKAKHHFYLAQTHKELREYERAAREYLNAYELYKDPAFFFNAGEMYRMAGDHKLAVKYFKKYLTQHPNGRVAEAAKSTVRKLQPKADLQVAREKLAKELARRKAEEQLAVAAKARREGESAGAARARQEAEAVATANARRSAEAVAKAKRDAEAAAAKAAAAKAKQDVEAVERARQVAATAGTGGNAHSTTERGAEEGSWSVEKRLKVAGIATGAVSVAALGVGAYFGFNAVSENSKLETLKDDQRFNPNFIDDRNSSRTAFYVLTGVGAGALIGGAVLYYLGEGESENPEERAAISVTPIATPDGASISCAGSF